MKVRSLPPPPEIETVKVELTSSEAILLASILFYGIQFNRDTDLAIFGEKLFAALQAAGCRTEDYEVKIPVTGVLPVWTKRY